MRYEWLDERIDEIINRYESGQSLQDIADALDVSTTPIHRRLRDHDVAMRNGGREHSQLADQKSELIAAYAKSDQSLQTLQIGTRRLSSRFNSTWKKLALSLSN